VIRAMALLARAGDAINGGIGTSAGIYGAMIVNRTPYMSQIHGS
jgi:hypothetical protein